MPTSQIPQATINNGSLWRHLIWYTLIPIQKRTAKQLWHVVHISLQATATRLKSKSKLCLTRLNPSLIGIHRSFCYCLFGSLLFLQHKLRIYRESFVYFMLWTLPHTHTHVLKLDVNFPCVEHWCIATHKPCFQDFIFAAMAFRVWFRWTFGSTRGSNSAIAWLVFQSIILAHLGFAIRKWMKMGDVFLQLD